MSTTIQEAVEEFRKGLYEQVFATGGPVEGSGGYINDYHTNTSIGADLLKKYGIPDESLQMVPSRIMDRDRTYGSAVALRKSFREHDMHIRRLMWQRKRPFATRRLFFSKALGPGISVGVIAVPNPDYDARCWWRYSDGVREWVGESIAYIYARFFFYPTAASFDKTGAANRSGASSHRTNENRRRRSWLCRATAVPSVCTLLR